MFRLERALLLIVGLVACAGSVAAQEVPTQPAFLVVASGARVRMTIAYALNADCTSMGQIVVRIVEKPKHGESEIVNEQGFSSYGKEDQKYKCNEKSSDIVNLYYKANEQFKGKDRLVAEYFYPNGSYRKRIFNFSVR
jgi:hypothetical protein